MPESLRSGNGVTLEVAEHPLLEVAAFVSELPGPLGELASPEWLLEGFGFDFEAPFESSAEIKGKVRDLLRVGGFKPTGRNKPASEYLIKAREAERLGSVNLVVDVCNVVSLWSGLPISVVDIDLAKAPLSIRVADAEESYIFNPSGQVLKLGGLLTVRDAEGPCANSVKDSQRTKTHDETRRTISVIWGTSELPGRAAEVSAWYRELLARVGVESHPLEA